MPVDPSSPASAIGIRAANTARSRNAARVNPAAQAQALLGSRVPSVCGARSQPPNMTSAIPDNQEMIATHGLIIRAEVPAATAARTANSIPQTRQTACTG
jgi:hypothetical protein